MHKSVLRLGKTMPVRIVAFIQTLTCSAGRQGVLDPGFDILFTRNKTFRSQR